MITYRVTAGVPLQLTLKVPGPLKKYREEPGTGNGTRALACWQQAKFVLAWFRDKPGLRRPGEGSGVSQSTGYRYKDEGVGVSRQSPRASSGIPSSHGDADGQQ